MNNLDLFQFNKQHLDSQFIDISKLPEPLHSDTSSTYSGNLVQDGIHSAICVNTLLSKQTFDAFINLNSKWGNIGSRLLFIFSDYQKASAFLAQNDLRPYLESEQVHVCDINHIDTIFGYLFREIRSPFIHCQAFLGSRTDDCFKLTEKSFDSHLCQYKKKSERALKHISEYYHSDKFKIRLKSFSQNKQPKVYVCRTCSSTAVKKFSNAIAYQLSLLGCQTYIHNECHNGQMDYSEADYIEIAKFKPDFIIYYPNLTNTALNAIPKLYSNQDIAPFHQLKQFSKRNSLGQYDFILLHYKQFYNQLKSIVTNPNQIIFHYLSAESTDSPATINTSPSPKVGLLKTLGASLSLKDHILSQKPVQLDNHLLIESIENKIIQLSKDAAKVSDQNLIELAPDQDWANTLPSYYLQHLNLTFVEALNSVDVPFEVIGKNWNLIPEFRKHHLGIAQNKDQVLKFFAGHLINLSINNSVEIHQRIFEGAQVDSFFLVYKVPEGKCLSKMPDDMKAGIHFDYFENQQELIDKCQYYLPRPDICKEIGHNLGELVRSKYTYQQLCSRILEQYKIIINNN